VAGRTSGARQGGKGKRRKTPPDPVSKYAAAVVAGRAPASAWVRLACQRHLDDLVTGGARGLRFDPAAALYAINFFPLLRHTKGEWAGQPFVLEPWQEFIVGSLFGWLRGDGTRRFRIAYIEIPRKNGKTTLAAGIALYMLVADGEPGAEVYSAATKRDQAKIVFNQAKAMARRPFGKRLEIKLHAIADHKTESFFVPLSADATTLDGLNPHCDIQDELHAHKNRDVVDVLETATGARREPLSFAITTAGFDRHSICWERHQYSEQVLEGLYRNAAADAWFAYIATIDEGDDWKDPACWAKANPSFGLSVKPDDLQRKCEKAIASPAAQNTFRQKHLDEWTEQATRWLDMAKWAKGGAPISEAALIGRDCFIGLDLASSSDLCAGMLVFPPVAAREPWKVLSRFWCPEENILKRSETDRVPYTVWRDQGHLTATPGDTTDFRFIEKQIREDAERFNVREVAYDRFLAEQLVQNLIDDGITMVPFGQNIGNITGPAKALERMYGPNFHHGDHPVLNWNAANVAVKRDENNNIKPDKKRSREKIDGIVAVIMALGRAVVHDAGAHKTIYDQGVEVAFV